jgi:hypothetical protein
MCGENCRDEQKAKRKNGKGLKAFAVSVYLLKTQQLFTQIQIPFGIDRVKELISQIINEVNGFTS